MKVRNRTICQTCRLRKIGCNGAKPACLQCTHSGRECSYPTDLLFVPETTAKKSKTPAKKSEKRVVTSNAISDKQLLRPRLPLMIPGIPDNPLQGKVLLIMQSFMPEGELYVIHQNKPTESRICGNWVEVLPIISSGGQGHALSSAIRCLAASISDLRQSSHSTRTELLYKYGLAMRSLKGELDGSHTDISSQDEVAVAIMCLTLTEMILPTSSNGWWRHIDGVGEWMRLWPAESFSFGIRHKLFAGFRPLVILKAFSSRKASFLSGEDWKRKPFEFQKESRMQLLFSEASIIPTVLELIDTLEHSPACITESIATEAIYLLKRTYDQLQDWGDPLGAEPSNGVFCWKVPSKSSSAWAGYNIWFPSVSVANVVMHLWTFKVVCLTEVQNLRTRFPHVSCAWPVPVDCELGDYLQETYRELCVRIVQGTDFLLQDRLALFGPLSIVFPLTTACEVFKIDGEPSAALWKFTSNTLQRSLLSKLQLGSCYFH
ncbi:hypothetical protein BFJ68_g1188 [Fusarium oxysporum]|uniref:Zn(2)-C6 fungal-type domain-containing protein n=1 Tax=Fusarium oxysporum TaxID=5507 RepID=A0A420S158_FUSOX|nr:hypothetical protein BFJ68_g1188 [Fusarium oxysporum]